MASKYKNLNITSAIPELAPEIIADIICPHNKLWQDKMCERLAHHWKTNEGFRNSFKRKDCREVCHMWFSHWYKSLQSGGKWW